jgi:hypothetical protein
MPAGDKTRQTFGIELSIVDLNRTQFEEPAALTYDQTPIYDSETSGHKIIDASNYWKDMVPHQNLRSINENVRGSIRKTTNSIELSSGYLRKNKERELLLNENSEVELIDSLSFTPDFYCYFRRTDSGTFMIRCSENHEVHIYHTENTSATEIANNLQSHGQGTGTSTVIAASVYPIKNTRVFTVDDTSTVREWTVLDSITEAMDTEYAVEVDSYSGLIKFGGAPNSYVGATRNALTDIETTITLFSSIENLKLPTRGIVMIDSEYIRYRNRSGHTLLECERGYNGSVAASHTEHSLVNIVTNGIAPAENETIFLAYDSTCFGVKDAEGIRISTVPESISAQKLVVVSNNTSILSSLDITSSITELSENIFGTMSAMSDTTTNSISVRALDQYANGIEGVAITVTALVEDLSFDGDSGAKTKITNINGDTRFSLSLTSDESFKSYYNAVAHSGSETIFPVEGTPFTSTSDVLIYQIVKGDLASGTVGRVSNVINVNSTISYFELAASGEDNQGEGVLVVLADATYYTFSGRLQNRKFYCDVSSSPDTDIATIESLVGSVKITSWYTNSLNTEWDAAYLNGTMLLLIEDTGSEYVPLFPLRASETEIAYGALLPNPYPNDPTKNLGGYCIVSPKKLLISIRGYQESTGASVEETVTIYAKIADRASAIVSSIPGSLTLAAESFNRTGLSAANFLSINPTAVYNSLDFRFKHI